MSLNKKIIINLKNLYENNFKKIQHPSIGQWLDLLKAENPDVYSFNEQKTVKLFEESMLENFERAKHNKNLVECYEKAIKISLNETDIVNSFSNDLKTSFEEIKKGVRNFDNHKIQILLLTYDIEPNAWISGFGEGKYPILKEPEYFDFNYRKDFFEGLGSINFSHMWNNLIKLQESLEEAGIYEEVLDTDFYQNLRNCYILKTYLLLNKAFTDNEKELFVDLDIKKPLLVYGHEHDCEKMNIYCYE